MHDCDLSLHNFPSSLFVVASLFVFNIKIISLYKREINKILFRSFELDNADAKNINKNEENFFKRINLQVTNL